MESYRSYSNADVNILEEAPMTIDQFSKVRNFSV